MLVTELSIVTNIDVTSGTFGTNLNFASSSFVHCPVDIFIENKRLPLRKRSSMKPINIGGTRLYFHRS